MPVSTHSQRRSGFTVLELLAVIGIIALVLGTFGVVFANYVQSSRVQATRATIAKIDAILKERMTAYRQQDFTAQAQRLVSQGSVANLETGKILALKQGLRIAFPQQAADNDRPPFNNISALTASNPNAESSAYLYLIITKGKTYGTPSVDDSFFSASETRTESGVTYFVDAWGEPLHYYRSASRLFWLGEDANGNGSLDAGEIDVDGDGNVTVPNFSVMEQARIILAPSVRFSSLGTAIHPLRVDADDRLERLRGLAQSGPVVYEATFQTPVTFSVPLIVSAGPDRVLGLETPRANASPMTTAIAASRRANPTSTVLAGDLSPLTDNITNLNLQALGGN